MEAISCFFASFYVGLTWFSMVASKLVDWCVDGLLAPRGSYAGFIGVG